MFIQILEKKKKQTPPQYTCTLSKIFSSLVLFLHSIFWIFIFSFVDDDTNTIGHPIIADKTWERTMEPGWKDVPSSKVWLIIFLSILHQFLKKIRQSSILQWLHQLLISINQFLPSIIITRQSYIWIQSLRF